MKSFFNLSEGATIALHCLVIIASSEEYYNTNKLAEITRFSKNHLAKILGILVKNGYLGSQRGPKGGFKLLADKSKVTLLDVLKLIDGRISKFECAITCNKCYFTTCLFGDHPEDFNNNFVKYLKNSTLSDIELKTIKSDTK
ncbi:MAG: Rrf2 family transcriptional regulator [Bacteroidales bacterium]|nr:Rrf2 family transcriptional regulator [Bacteroidales bacterium]